LIASTASSQDASARAVVANSETPHALPEATTGSVKEKVAVAKAVETEAVKTRETPPKRAKVEAIETERVRRSADVVRRPNIPVAPQRRFQPIALIVAVVFAAIGIGAPWIRFHNVPGLGRLQQLAMSLAKQATAEVADVQDRAALPIEGPADPRTAVQDRSAAPPEEHPAAPTPTTLPRERPAVPTTATQDRKSSTTASPEASTPIRRKPTTTPVASPRRTPVPAPAKPVRVKDSTREVPAAPVLASAPVIAPAVVDVVAAAPTPAPAAPLAAVGPFFETRDVSESPRIATRAEPRLPTGLKDRAIKEMVVVRALVSQSGHPSRVSLLRRSKSGPELDDVVVAAVNHWTFAPAKKKGEPVSCWFNFAVEVGGTE
jgi:TonB family protein